jgi:hypothetical protein
MLSIDTFNIVVYTWIGIAVVIFPVLLKVTAPYGRHAEGNWGPVIDNRQGWVIMELPALLVFTVFMLMGYNLSQGVVLVFFLLWVVHYFHRSIIFPFRIKTKDKKMPVVIMLSAVFFNLVNGFVNGYWLGILSPGYPDSWFSDPRFIIGALVFITGFGINQYHDKILLGLRKNSNGEYKIPREGLFRYVSCPNFFGEIVEWGGFALMTWCLPSFSFFLWTFVNLVPRALDHHRWYKQHFPDYPAGRKAVIPFLI